MWPICVYTFEAFPLPAELLSSVDFVCFSNESQYPVWQQKQLPLDILHFSSIRQQKIVKILPWKYLPEYDYAIWCESIESFCNAFLLNKAVDATPFKDVYYLPDESISIDTYFEVNGRNLNVKSQLQKYQASSNFAPQCFISTDLIAFNVHSPSFKQFSINWMNETLKESLNDEVSFTYLLSFSSMLDAYECRPVIEDADCFFKIVIPNYNNGYSLEKCLESILSQSFKSFKIVIVDDCSTDESLNIAKRYAEDYPEQIFFLSTNERSYSGYARNVGANFNQFTSKYTWFVDGDDMLYKDDVLKDLFEKASISNADLISFDCSYVKDGKPSIKKFSIPDFSDSNKALNQFGIAPWHRIIKTDKVVSFFENCIRRQDLATVFRQYAACNKIAHLDKVCYIYNTRDYASLKEPIWSLENVYIELMKQSRELSSEYSAAILCYLSKYPKIFGWLDESKLKEQIVVAMASYPLRKAGMLKVFHKLFPQCDHFCLYLNEYEKIPDELLDLTKEEKQKITIEIGGDNLKDYGKFFWWKRFPGYYLTVDDDLDYPEDYCQTLKDQLQALNRKVAIGMHGNDFTVVGDSFVAGKTCHSFLAKEDHLVPVDCLGTGAACFYPAETKFSFNDIVNDYRVENDLDMSVSILMKREGKMLYRIPSKKEFVKMDSDRINFINPLADIHFAWENRYLQYDFWLHSDLKNDKCAFCCLPYNEVDLNTMDLLNSINNVYKKDGVDFYFIPIEERPLLKDNNEMHFVKFEFVKKFIERYSCVSIHPLKEKDKSFDFTKDNTNEILNKIWKIKEKKQRRMSDKILKAQLRKV